MTEYNEPLQVSDWSQPYKLAVYVIAIVGLVAFVWYAVIPWANEVLGLLRQITENTSK